MRKLNNIQADQNGFVSIIVTMILMIVLTLIVLSFAQLARREQRNALDRQLSTQAFYAAESGVNDFVTAMENGTIDTTATPTRTTCSGSWPLGPNSNKLDSALGTEYTCVLYNTSPPSLKYDSITSSQVTIVPISNNDLQQIRINWGGDTTDTSFRPPTPATLPQFGSWASDAGLLKAVLIPRHSVQRDYYLNNTFTGFMYPLASGAGAGNVNFAQGRGANNSGVIGSGQCNNPGNTPYRCNININALPSGAGSAGDKGWYLVLLSIYKDSHVIITCNNGTDVPCRGAQVVIDATGRANDVIRRIQVRKPLLGGAGDFLPIGFESVNSICKRIQVVPPAINDVGAPGCAAY